MTVQAKLPRRSRLVDGANKGLSALYASRAVCRPELDADAICHDLSQSTGLADWGGEWFRKPLRVLIESLCEEAALNPLGQFAAVGQIRKVLKDRLHAEHFFTEHPEIERRSLKSPVIVVGPMRSGTTRLHRLLASDHRFAHMRSFETIDPVPKPGFYPGAPDRRWITARLAMGAIHAFNPMTAIIHPSGPFEPEEELGLLVRSIWGMKNEAQWHIPSYSRWAESQDAAPAYYYMARLLRLIGWARGEGDQRPWVLKTPQHMLDLPALLQVFPDARIIFTHRDPKSVVGSSCSLVYNQMIIHSDQVDPQEIGREWLYKTDLQIKRMRRARVALPKHRRMDVRYSDVERDWKGVMRDIYRFLDMDIEPALPSMAAYMKDSGRELHRHPHRYSLAAFGLKGDEVGEFFASYSQAFELDVPAARNSIVPEGSGKGLTRRHADWDTVKPARAATAGRR